MTETETTTIMKQKQVLRRRLLEARQGQSPQERQEKSERICENIMKLPWFWHADTLIGYVPVRGEVDVRPLLQEAFQKNKRILLPRCLDRSGHMAFFEVHSRRDLVPGPFQIPEPREGLEMVTSLRGMMLVPGVGFDLLGNRLGYGGGYYDRYVSQEQQVITVAPAYELQLEQSIPIQEHDARVRWIVTEQRLIERKYGG